MNTQYPLNVPAPHHFTFAVRDIPEVTVEQRERALKATHYNEFAFPSGLLTVDVQSDIIDAYNDSILGEEREVLCEGYDSQAQMFYGRSYAESPDIDGRIWFTADSEITPGSFVNVRLTGIMDGETTGEMVEA